MAIEQKYTDLINADIDGEISEADRAELQAFLDESPEGRSLCEELASLCTTLDATEQEEPPPYLRHIIMNSVPPTRTPEESRGFLQALFAAPAVRYAATFAAGIFVALSIVNSSQISNKAFDNVTGLVGTVADPIDATLAKSVSISENAVAGTVSLRSAGSLLILDFDLSSMEQVEIEANYTDSTIWFAGFAQLESDDTTISAETGRIKLGMEGKRRYAVYLQNTGNRKTTVELQFVAGGKIVNQSSLEYTPAD